MSRTLWVADGAAPDGDDDYVVLAGVQVRDWLFTIVSCPEAEEPPLVEIETRLPSGQVLPWRSTSGLGGDMVDLTTARGTVPPDGTEELFVTVKADGRHVAEARLVRTPLPAPTDMSE